MGMLRSPRQLRSTREIAAMREAGFGRMARLEGNRAAGAPRCEHRRYRCRSGWRIRTVSRGNRLFMNFPNSTPGWPPFPAVTCISINEEVVHGIPNPRRKIERGRHRQHRHRLQTKWLVRRCGRYISRWQNRLRQTANFWMLLKTCCLWRST